MKTILILFPVFFSALFAVSAQIRDTTMQDTPTALADRSPSAPLPDSRGAIATSQDASVEREVRVSEAGSAVRMPDEPRAAPDEPAEIAPLPASALLDVPFASQAPYENWQLPYKEACEETSVIMVQYYLEGIVPLEETVKNQILAIVDYESGHGYAHDLNIADTGKVAEEFYGVEATTYYDDEVTKESIQRLIAE